MVPGRLMYGLKKERINWKPSVPLQIKQQGAKLEYAIASVDTQQVLLQPLRAEQFIEAPTAEVELLEAPNVVKRVDMSMAELVKTTETFAVVEKAESQVTQN